jgi:hypothetical protein
LKAKTEHAADAAFTVGNDVGIARPLGGTVGDSPEGLEDGCAEGPTDPEGAAVGAVGELEGGVVDGKLLGEADGMLVVSERHLALAS